MLSKKYSEYHDIAPLTTKNDQLLISHHSINKTNYQLGFSVDIKKNVVESVRRDEILSSDWN